MTTPGNLTCNLSMLVRQQAPSTEITHKSKSINTPASFNALINQCYVLAVGHGVHLRGQANIFYEDNGRTINVSNDEEVRTALTWAENTVGKTITFQFKAPEGYFQSKEDALHQGIIDMNTLLEPKQKREKREKKERAPRMTRYRGTPGAAAASGEESKDPQEFETPNKKDRIPRKVIKALVTEFMLTNNIVEKKINFYDMLAIFKQKCDEGQKEQLYKKFQDTLGVGEEYLTKLFAFKPCKYKRAVIVNKEEAQTFAMQENQTVFAQVEVLNQTNKAWKPECKIVIDTELSDAELPIKEVDQPCALELQGCSTARFEVPLSIKENEARKGKVYEIFLRFENAKGKSFGERFPVKVQF